MISNIGLSSDQFKYSHVTLHAGWLQFIFIPVVYRMTSHGVGGRALFQGALSLLCLPLERETENVVGGEQYWQVLGFYTSSLETFWQLLAF